MSRDTMGPDGGDWHGEMHGKPVEGEGPAPRVSATISGEAVGPEYSTLEGTLVVVGALEHGDDGARSSTARISGAYDALDAALLLKTVCDVLMPITTPEALAYAGFLDDPPPEALARIPEA